ncbi:MAG: DNA topoisomerase IV subunit A [Alphaproteobacteria bacterium]|nr:DNA topoisomerase IV subunit A [Alphaproteobacteria bacterium]MBP7729267.1 DNA topoisomerase IV subunit A [Alphaproteobacteria bacterium]
MCMTIQDVELVDALGERYLSYALSTIMQRSLPDVRDGLKPVHRRLLYAMRELKLDPKSGYKKCARVVGDVIGKFHPHGEIAIYDAMVRLAQDFAVRLPLVDGQGNFGNIDGDSAAAMRYTEARLTAVAETLMEGLDQNAVDFKTTYDGENSEPIVMPARFPNLLVNGATGIAVGMATSIPPHNLSEVCEGLIALIRNPDIEIEDLVKLIPGPDFPTGGILVETPENILKAYQTGRGSFRLRAKWEVEKLEFGQYQIVITEIPYLVQKSKLIEKIASLLSDKKLPLLGDMQDESTDKVRLIFEPKSRSVDPAVLMESLFRHTDLDGRIPLNMNVVDGKGVPGVKNLKQILEAFYQHRLDVLERTTQFRLDKIDHRLAVLEGYLIAYLNLDEVIRLIREEDNPSSIFQERWGLSEVQAEAILNMRLRSLRKLEEIEIRREHETLSQEKAELRTLLDQPSLQQRKIIQDLETIKAQFSKKTYLGQRRTVLSDLPEDINVPIEAIIERELVTVVCSQKGWVRALKGHTVEANDIKYKDGDEEQFLLKAETTDKLLVFTTLGRFYTISIDKLSGGRGHGDPLRLLIDLTPEEDVVDLLVHSPQVENRKILVASADGRGFITSCASLLAQTRGGKQILNVEKTKAALCREVTGDHLAIIGQNRKLLIYKIDEIPEMVRGKGVILQRYKNGGLSDIKLFTLAEGLSWKMGEKTRLETRLLPWLGKRGQGGKLPPTGFPRTNRF